MISKESINEKYTSNSNDKIIFKIVKNFEDLENDKINFSPQFSHQFFGEGEKIFGYKNPKIELYFSALSLTPYFHFSYEEIISTQNGLHADDIKNILLEKIDNVKFDIDVFKNIVESDISFNVGKLIHQYSKIDETGSKDVFEVFHVTGNDLQSKSFKLLNIRLQYILLFFVDGSSFIDIDDKNWEYLVVYQKCKNAINECQNMPIGFMTVYNFFAYPDKIRQRISQVLILPPYQRHGHGGELLNSFYRLVRSNSLVYDVTVEDPSDQFQVLRDYTDCCNVLQLADFDKDLVKKGLFKKFSQLMMDKLKMTKKQSIRVYEILGFKFINRNNDIEYMKLKQSVTKRLTVIFARAKDFLNIEAQNYLNVGQEQKAIMIDKEYSRLEEYYSAIVTKLDKSYL